MVKKIIFLITLISLAAALVFASQSEYYADLGNITSDSNLYNCWPSCLAYVNLTPNSSGIYASNWTVSLNNTAEDSSVNFTISWFNDTEGWELFGNESAFINNSNLDLNTSSTYQFRINITLPYALTTKWNITFTINDSSYILDPYIDSINLTHPVNNNVTNDQTPEFNYTLYSDSHTLQSCSLYINVSGTWTGYGSNASTLNGSNAAITSSSLSNGTYSWKITCNESGDSPIRQISIDDNTAPTISSVSSSPSSTSVVISWTTNENGNSSVSYGTSESLGSLEDSATMTTSHSIEILDLSSSTNYYYNVTSCDAQGNCATSGPNTFTTSSYTAPTGSSGGAVTASTTKSKTWSLITAGSTKTWTVNDQNTGIKSINITVSNESKSVKLTLSKYASKPSPVSTKAGEVYKYISIATENLQHLSAASLIWQVDKSWVENASLTKEDVSLFKFDNSTNQWVEIETTYDSEDSTYYYYKSVMNSFSYFAMAGPDPVVEETIPTTNTTSSSEGTNATVSETQENAEGGGEETSRTGVIILLVVIGVVAIIVVVIIIYTQLIRKRQK